MKNQQKEMKNSNEPKSVENVSVWSSPFTIAMIAAWVAIVGSGLTWYSNRESTKQAMVISCLARIDTQETKIREHAEPFFKAVGTMLGRIADPTHSRAVFLEIAEPVVTHSYSLLAYVPADVGFASINFGNVIIENMRATTTEEQVKIMADSQDRISGILTKYDEYMKKFQAQKIACQNQ
ncbi:hypothetical protein [Pseudomonas sp. SDO55104_S430]